MSVNEDESTFNLLKAHFGSEGDADTLILAEFAAMSDKRAEFLLDRISSFKVVGQISLIRNRAIKASQASRQAGATAGGAWTGRVDEICAGDANILTNGGDEKFFPNPGAPEEAAEKSPPWKIRRLIRTVSFEELVVPLSGCSNIRTENVPGYVVDMDRVMVESMKVINDELEKLPDLAGSFRRDPLVFSRLARGGKTTVLTTLFAALKSAGRLAMIISFNGTSGFVHHSNETEEQAIIRQIVLQLIDQSAVFPTSELGELKCDEHVLDKYLDKQTRFGERDEIDFVLLIDELNVVGAPLSVAASKMLQRLFLQKNRYLVFSTHVPLYLSTEEDCSSSDKNMVVSLSNSTEIRVVQMPQCMDLTELRKMDKCEALTSHEATIYGGIPALIYTAQSKPEFCATRFGRAVPLFRKKYPETLTDSASQYNLLKEFVGEIFSGINNSPVALRFFDQFGSIPEASHIRWPLCYLSEILCVLMISEPAGVAGVITEICDLCKRHIPVFASIVETGLDWQSVVDVAILLQALRALLWNVGDRFIPSSFRVKSIGFVKMPDQHRTLKAGWRFMRSLPRQEGHLVIIRSTFAKFPLFDGFVVAMMPSGELYVTGYQVKLGRKTPRYGVPGWMKGGGILLRGVAASSSTKTPNGWTFMSQTDIQSFLGYSLAPLYPSSWVSDVREEDKFD